MEVTLKFEALPESEGLPLLLAEVVKSLSFDEYVSYRYVQTIKSGIWPPDHVELKEWTYSLC